MFYGVGHIFLSNPFLTKKRVARVLRPEKKVLKIRSYVLDIGWLIMVDEIRMLQSSAMGYGNVSESLIERGLGFEPDIIVGQGTGTDPGPYHLGSDDMYPYVGKSNKKKDIGLILKTAAENGIPFIFSGGSPSGSNLHLEGVLRIVDEIAEENGYEFQIAVIAGEIDKKYLKVRLARGEKMRRIVNTPRINQYLTIRDIEQSKRIVAQMGPEPIIKALDFGVDGVITGRALDIGLHMAYPLKKGFNKGIAAHMAKTIECGALCASPPMNENVFAILRKDHFLVFPLNRKRKCTVASVAAHAFYERPDITRELNPGGYLDISEAKYLQYDERTVEVSGGKWVPMPYTVKLEGVARAGCRTISIIGVRDPMLIQNIDRFLSKTTEKVKEKFAYSKKQFEMFFDVYGRNAVLGPAEPQEEATCHELCIIINVVADNQELADAVCGYTRGRVFFGDYPGKTTTAGNVAVRFSPQDIRMGEVYIWNIWHSMGLEDPCDPFRIKVTNFPRG